MAAPSPAASPLKNKNKFSPKEGVELDPLIKEISSNIGYSWKFLARRLGFPDTDIDAIEYANPHELKEQIYQFFRQWQQREGMNASPLRLIKAIEEESLDHLLEALEKKGLIHNQAHLLQPAPPLTLTPTRLDPDVVPDATVDQPQPLKSTSKPAPTLPGSNDLNRDEDEREYVRRKRLERLASNASNQSASSEVSNQSESSHGPQRKLSMASNSSCTGNTLVSEPSAVKKFEVDDCIKVERANAAPWYGVVKWLGELPEIPGKLVAGIEMENVVDGGCKGSKDGVCYFQCEDKHGLFLPIERLDKDDRFQNVDDATDNLSSSPSQNVSNQKDVNSASNVQSTTSPSQSAGFQSGGFLSGLLSRLNLGDSPPSSQGAQENTTTESEAKVLIFTIPADRVGLVIGREGRNIQEVERLTNTSIKMMRDDGRASGNKMGIIHGSEENKKKALVLILNRLKKRVSQQTAKTETIDIPEAMVGKVIGKGGQTISAIKSLSGVVDIKIEDRPQGLATFLDLNPSRKCMITGSEEEIEKAKRLITLAMQGGDIVMGATLAALIVELGRLGVEIEES